VSKVLVKVAGLNVLPTLVQASKTYIEVYRTQRMQALLIFFSFFFVSSVALLYLHLPFTSLFLSKVLQNNNTIQSNEQNSYQPDTDSLLNIL
jgi:Na+/phosphate symporter